MNEILQLAGVGGVPLVKQLVDLSKAKGIWAVLVSQVFAIVLNVALSFATNSDLKTAFAIGIITGFLSNVYNDAKKEI